MLLKGAGDVFSSGLDVKSVTSNPLNMVELLKRPDGKLANLAQEVAWVWRTVPAPVIAVTHGVCFGGGLQIALGADFRFTTADCKFSIMEAKWGLIPDMAGTVLLREVTSIDVAKELTMTARVFDGRDALKYGLVSRVCDDPLSEARALAAEIGARSPDCVAAAKQLFNSTWSVPEKKALETETVLQKELLMPPLKNTLAATSQGMKLPIQLQFVDRKDTWKPSRE